MTHLRDSDKLRCGRHSCRLQLPSSPFLRPSLHRPSFILPSQRRQVRVGMKEGRKEEADERQCQRLVGLGSHFFQGI